MSPIAVCSSKVVPGTLLFLVPVSGFTSEQLISKIDKYILNADYPCFLVRAINQHCLSPSYQFTCLWSSDRRTWRKLPYPVFLMVWGSV